MDFPAHIYYLDKTEIVQSVTKHCRNCAINASAAAMDGIKNTAYLSGLLHDMGKFTLAFKEYISKAVRGEHVQRGSVNHTFAGVRFAFERWHNDTSDYINNMTCEIISFAIGAHHGLFDCINPDGKDGFLHRITKDDIFYEEAKENYLKFCTNYAELDCLFESAKKEISNFISICKPYAKSEQELHFYISLLQRLLLSALIDADRKDTAEFMMNISLPKMPDSIAHVWEETLDKIEINLKKLPSDSPIDKVRWEISDTCLEAAKFPNGIYRLSVPTGGGKTLASLRYAVAAAMHQKKKRVFFIVPLLSVLEQNASVIRKYVNNDDLVLEHHSNLVREESEIDEINETELLVETWNAPIIITTLVQFLNTLFLGKTSCVRRLNALQNAVIVIDEVQSVPRKMLSLFNLALNFLVGVCNTTIVLCSATQPYLEDANHPVNSLKLGDLMPRKSDTWDIFRRTEIFDNIKPHGYTKEELACFAKNCQKTAGSILIICNTKAQARQVFDEIKKDSQCHIFHLSTAMCMAHRINTLTKINQCLEKKLPVFCISTQLVEAGVDFSFGCVIRISSGLDNIVQAAGRCNRNGEYGKLCPVYIVNFRGENLNHLKEIQQSQLAAESILHQFKKSPSLFNDLASDTAITAYYHRLYTNMSKNEQDFHIETHGTSLYSMLSDNQSFQSKSAAKNNYVISQAFKTAGRSFSVFDNLTQDVLITYEASIDLINDLLSKKSVQSLSYRKHILDKAKRYTISLYDYELKQLQKVGGIYSACNDTIYILRKNFYSNERGLLISEADCLNNLFMEV